MRLLIQRYLVQFKGKKARVTENTWGAFVKSYRPSKVQSSSLEKYLVCFDENCLDINIPNQKTIISKNHLVYDKKQKNTS